MTHAYFISGLGADHSVFQKLELRDDIEVHPLAWLKPKKEESLDNYVDRMAARIEHPEEAVLVGLSFGGIVALEIARRYSIKKVILISSVKHRDEMPINFNLIGLMGLHQLIPASKLMHQRELAAWFFGTRKQEDKEMLYSIIDHTDETLVDWSTDKIVSWKGDYSLENVKHIHGTADTIFPIRNVKADKVIKGGPHFMVYTHAKEVSNWLNTVI